MFGDACEGGFGIGILWEKRESTNDGQEKGGTSPRLPPMHPISVVASQAASSEGRKQVIVSLSHIFVCIFLFSPWNNDRRNDFSINVSNKCLWNWPFNECCIDTIWIYLYNLDIEQGHFTQQTYK